MVTMGDLMATEALLAIGGLAIIASLHYRNVKVRPHAWCGPCWGARCGWVGGWGGGGIPKP